MATIKFPSGDSFTLIPKVTVIRMKGIQLRSHMVSIYQPLADALLFSGKEVLVNWPVFSGAPMNSREEYDALREIVNAVSSAQLTNSPLIAFTDEGAKLDWLDQIGVTTYDFNGLELTSVPNEAELDANLLSTTKYFMLIIDHSKWLLPMSDAQGLNGRHVQVAWDAFRAELKDREQVFNFFYWDHTITDRAGRRAELLKAFNDNHTNIVIGFAAELPEKWKTYAEDVFIWDGVKLTTDSDHVMTPVGDGTDEISYALGLVAEECSEISHACMKALRFGLHDSPPSGNLTNLEKIVKEVHDLYACLLVLEQQLEEAGVDVSFTGGEDLIKRKLNRLRMYQERSISNGRLARPLIIPEVTAGEPKSAG